MKRKKAVRRLRPRKLAEGEMLKEAPLAANARLATPRGYPFLLGPIESQLDIGTRARLEAFCKAHHGADPATIINKAVDDFMETDLAGNADVAARYKGQK